MRYSPAAPVEEVRKVFERILLSVDGSPDSDRAVRATRDLARVHGSSVLVVHGRDLALLGPPAPTAPVRPPQTEMESLEEAQGLVDSAVEELRTGEVEARGEVLPGRGRIGQQIVEAAQENGVDLIVLGSRGMSRVHELMIGSVADRVIRLSECPVLLVR